METIILIFAVCAALVGVYFFWDRLDRRNARKRRERDVVAGGLAMEPAQLVRKDPKVRVQFAGETLTGYIARRSGHKVRVAVEINGRRRIVTRKVHEIQQV